MEQTVVFTDLQRLEAFHMKCQRQIFNVYWWDHVSNYYYLLRIKMQHKNVHHVA